jgi:hypothetical protein
VNSYIDRPTSSISLSSEMLRYNSMIQYIKSKAVPLHAMEAHGGRGGIVPTHT